MNSRNYDNVPPIVGNTVTIATTAPQMRISSSGQIRQMPVPLRQPVPIRKVVHDTGGSTPLQYLHHQIKEDPDGLEYQTASTSASSGPLIAGPSGNSNNFQQYQRGGGPSTSAIPSPSTSSVNNQASMAMDQPAPVNLASKVAEVFLTAGHAFQKLGDLTLQLHTTTDTDESKWSEKEVDSLKNALTRFAHELDQISSCVTSRTTKHIKNDIKRRHLITDDSGNSAKRMALGGVSGSGSGTYTTINTGGLITGHAVPLAQKRIGMQPIKTMMTTRTMVPTRYTVAPMSSSAGGGISLSNSTVLIGSGGGPSSSSSPGPSGMPQLQSQGASTSSSSAAPPRLAPATRLMTPAQMLGKLKQPTSGALTLQPASGALILNDE
ncbi:unnamed protein product [Caenorhabditis sp. 36 PRJEB53466]|nr:unnamed protein product [Caenorhabditis sp. 36 PRJEB53466]